MGATFVIIIPLPFMMNEVYKANTSHSVSLSMTYFNLFLTSGKAGEDSYSNQFLSKKNFKGRRTFKRNEYLIYLLPGSQTKCQYNKNKI